MTITTEPATAEWTVRAIDPDTYEGPGTVTTVHGTSDDAQGAVDQAAADGWVDARAEGPFGTVLVPTVPAADDAQQPTKSGPTGEVPRFDNSHLDLRDRAALAEARVARKATLRDHPEVGEWVRFACGTMRRVSHVWEWGNGPESIQTSDGGSFHMHASGTLSMSGGLHPGMKPETFKPTDETRPGWVWIWHHGRAAAHNGVNARIPFRVWENTEPAN